MRERKKETRFGFVRVSLPKRPSFRLGQKVQNGVILCCILKLLSDGLVKYSILLRNGLSTLSKVQTNP